MSKNKKIIVTVAMVMLLAVTTYFNVVLTKAQGNDGALVPTASFFQEYKSERTTTRQQEMLYLDSIISNKALDEQTIKDAVKEKMEIVSLMETELVLEGLIKAKGFQEVAVTMASSSDNINVVVKSAELKQEDVANIYSVIASETSAKHSNVKIIPIE